MKKEHQTDINEGEGFSPGPLKPAGTVFEGDEGPKGACDSDKIPVSAHSSQRVASGTDTFSGKSAPGPSPSSSADATTTGVEGEFTEDLSSIYLLNSQGTSRHASGNSRWKLPFIADNILQQKNIIRKSQLHQV